MVCSNRMAKLTKRDVLQVDISSIQSKWVGESEKNTKAVFQEYYKACEILKSKPILLFNEALYRDWETHL